LPPHTLFFLVFWRAKVSLCCQIRKTIAFKWRLFGLLLVTKMKHTYIISPPRNGSLVVPLVWTTSINRGRIIKTSDPTNVCLSNIMSFWNQMNEHFWYFKCACFSVYASQGSWTADSGHSFAWTISIDNIRHEIWTRLLGNGAKKLFLLAFGDVFFFHSTWDQAEYIIYIAPMMCYCFYFFGGKTYTWYELVVVMVVWGGRVRNVPLPPRSCIKVRGSLT